MSGYVVGYKELDDRLKAMSEVDLRQGLRQSVMLVEQVAKAGAPAHDGQLRGSITSWVEQNENGMRGICAANAAYAMYVEFGTGQRGAMDHSGISPNVTPAYTLEPWWIHEGDGPNEISRQTAEYYHFPFIETEQGRFYRCTGQPANPFMYQAFKACEEEITNIMRRKVKEQIDNATG